MYLNDKRFTIRTSEKKDGIVWIVDLKISKKWKGNEKKKMGFAELCIWNVRDLLRRKEKKKDGFNQVVDLKLTKNIKGKQKKKMGVGQSCVFEW